MSRVYLQTTDAIKTLPGYLQKDTFKRFGNLNDYPVKFDPSYMYWSQIAAVFPRNQVLTMLLSKKLESITESLPYGPN